MLLDILDVGRCSRFPDDEGCYISVDQSLLHRRLQRTVEDRVVDRFGGRRELQFRVVAFEVSWFQRLQCDPGEERRKDVLLDDPIVGFVRPSRLAGGLIAFSNHSIRLMGFNEILDRGFELGHADGADIRTVQNYSAIGT